MSGAFEAELACRWELRCRLPLPNWGDTAGASRHAGKLPPRGCHEPSTVLYA